MKSQNTPKKRDRLTYYEHSGTIPLLGVILGALGGMISALFVAIVCGFFAWLLAGIGQEHLIVIIFGGILGYVPARIMIAMKVRNTPFVLVATAVIALMGLYSAFVLGVYFNLRSGGSPVSLQEVIQSPIRMYHVARRTGPPNLLAEGRWIFVENICLTIFVFCYALVLARKMSDARPFCERCDCWCDGPNSIAKTEVVDSTDLRSHLERGDFSGVKQLIPADENVKQFLSWEICVCPKCRQFQTLTVSRLTVQKFFGTKSNRNKRQIVGNIIIPPDRAVDLY